MLTRTAVEQRTQDLGAAHFKTHRGALDQGTRFREDLGADSLDLVGLVFTLEQELGVSFSDDAALDPTGEQVSVRGGGGGSSTATRSVGPITMARVLILKRLGGWPHRCS